MSLVVLSTISCKEALIELVPEYEHESGRKLDVTYAGGPGLTEEIRGGKTADLFIGPGEFSNPLIAEGKLAGASRTAFARSSTASSGCQMKSVAVFTTLTQLDSEC